MEVTVSAIHCTIPESLHDHAARLGRRLDRYEPRAAILALTFENPNGLRLVEARLTSAGGPPLLARATAATYRAAMNQAVDRIERQLKRRRQRVRQGRRAPAAIE
jgi:ribosome-associated translation inhibitor RaiA